MSGPKRETDSDEHDGDEKTVIYNMQPIAARRSILARSILALCNKRGPLTMEERRRLDEATAEIKGLDGAIQTEADRKYAAAFSSYLRRGLNLTQNSRGISAEERAILYEGQRVFGELRDLGLGNQGAFPGSTAGFLAPMGFFDQVTSAERFYGPMLDTSTIHDMQSGAQMAFPSDNDTIVAGELLDEFQPTTEADVPADQVTLGAYIFSSKLVKVNLALVNDAGFPLEAYLTDRFGIRLARAINPFLTNGTGIKQPTGLITVASTGATAVGAFSNDGASAANSVGSDDIVNLELSVDPAYRIGAQYMMHPDTLASLKRLKDKNGRPIYSLGEGNMVNGYSVQLNPSMDQLQTAPSSPPVIRKTVAFGRLSRYVVRRAPLVVLRLAERGFEYNQVWYLAFHRVDGNLMDGGGGAVKVLENVF